VVSVSFMRLLYLIFDRSQGGKLERSKLEKDGWGKNWFKKNFENGFLKKVLPILLKTLF
jgi:hypothetical protein